jgi:hypothetical protein
MKPRDAATASSARPVGARPAQRGSPGLRLCTPDWPPPRTRPFSRHPRRPGRPGQQPLEVLRVVTARALRPRRAKADAGRRTAQRRLRVCRDLCDGGGDGGRLGGLGAALRHAPQSGPTARPRHLLSPSASEPLQGPSRWRSAGRQSGWREDSPDGGKTVLMEGRQS